MIPRETPCIGCLLGRVRERWGDHQPAPEPAVVTDHGLLAAALVSTEVERCLDGDTSLVGRTVAWDLQQRRVTSERLLTVPVCPYCSDFDNPGVIPRREPSAPSSMPVSSPGPWPRPRALRAAVAAAA